MTSADILRIFEMKRRGFSDPIIAHTLNLNVLDIKDLGPASSHKISMPPDNSWLREVDLFCATLTER